MRESEERRASGAARTLAAVAHPWFVAAVATAVALAVRWDFAVVEHPPDRYLVGDMAIYLERARSLFSRATNAYDTFTPVGYPAFLALLDALAPGDVGFVGAAQALLGAATVGGSALLAAELQRLRHPDADALGGLGPAALVGAALAFYFPLVLYTGFVLTETLCAFLLVAFALLGARALAEGRARSAAAAGVVLGVAALVRPSLLAIVPLLVPWCVVSSPPGRRVARVLLAAFVLAIAPVVVLDFAILGRPALVATNGGVNFLLAHADCRAVRSRAGGPVVEVSTFYSRTHFERTCVFDAPFTDERAYYRAGFAALAEHPTRLLTAFDGVAEGVGLGPARPWPNQPYWPGSTQHDAAINGFSRAFFWIVLLPALAGGAARGWAARRGGGWSLREPTPERLLWALFASVLVVLYAFNGNPRVRVSSDPLTMVLASLALWEGGGLLRRLVRQRWLRRPA